jgi:hypothetical protein
MARGFDDLIDFLLSEIALCGTQGTWGDNSIPSFAAYSPMTFEQPVVLPSIRPVWRMAVALPSMNYWRVSTQFHIPHFVLLCPIDSMSSR